MNVLHGGVLIREVFPGGQSVGLCGFAGVWLVGEVRQFWFGVEVSIDFVDVEVK